MMSLKHSASWQKNVFVRHWSKPWAIQIWFGLVTWLIGSCLNNTAIIHAHGQLPPQSSFWLISGKLPNWRQPRLLLACTVIWVMQTLIFVPKLCDVWFDSTPKTIAPNITASKVIIDIEILNQPIKARFVSLLGWVIDAFAALMPLPSIRAAGSAHTYQTRKFYILQTSATVSTKEKRLPRVTRHPVESATKVRVASPC